MIRFVFSAFFAAMTAQGLSATILPTQDDSDRFSLSGTPRALEQKIAISDTAAVNKLLRHLVEEFEGKPENPVGFDSAHLAILLKDDQNACRKGKQIDANLFTYACTVKYRANNWNGVMKATLLVEKGEVTQLFKAGFDGFQN